MITLHTFNLCKQLHELKPNWQPIGAYVIKSEGDEPQLCRDDIHRTCYDWAPEFTIDYLLEKLPNRVVDGFDFGALTLSTKKSESKYSWIASYNNDAGYPIGNIDGVAETALDAVLELTIEMAKRKEI